MTITWKSTWTLMSNSLSKVWKKGMFGGKSEEKN